MMSPMRTVIDVPDEVIATLDQVSCRVKRSRAALIRDAISEYLRKNALPPADEAFGIWKGKPVDGMKYQESLRKEWQSR